MSNIKLIEQNGQHFYEREGIIYPSVTTVLSIVNKGHHFETWLKQNGTDADKLRDSAAERGTNVHKGIKLLIDGLTVYKANYSAEEWKMLNRFVSWVLSLDSFKPIESETSFIYDKELLKYAGTVDLIAEINGETWLIDFKTGNGDYITYHFQVGAYAKALKKIDKVGILFLGMNTQKGWKLTEVTDVEECFSQFASAYALWVYQNPADKWIIKDELPDELKLGTAELKLNKEVEK